MKFKSYFLHMLEIYRIAGLVRKANQSHKFFSCVDSRAIVALWKNINLRNQRLEVIASVEDGAMKYAVQERQAVDQPHIEIEEASMSELVHMQIPITVSNSFTTSKFFGRNSDAKSTLYL